MLVFVNVLLFVLVDYCCVAVSVAFAGGSLLLVG